jgi:hypothetical protein
MDFVNQTFSTLDTTLAQAFANPYFTAVVTIFIVVYGSMAAPDLPDFLASLFDYALFKMLILTLILLINNYNPMVAITMAVAFFISLQTLSRLRLRNLAQDVLSLGKPTKEAENDEESSSDEGEEVMEYNQGPGGYSQVSGMAGRGIDYQGPQGMKHPVGFAEDALPGAEFV